MQSNIDCIMDDLNDFPDSWVEIYNSGDEAADLSQFRLGTSNKATEAWQFPSFSLSPKSYALVWCDKAEDDWKNYPSSRRERLNWHTPFRLESAKDCKLYLFKDGKVIDQLPSGMKKQPAPNIAYGRTIDGGSEWGYQAVPTPKAANCGKIYKNILGEPVFSAKGFVFTQKKTVAVELSLPNGSPAGTQIRYTTDCSEPTEKSTLYSGKISFNNTTVIKAKLFCDGYLSPRSTTQSYIYLDHNPTLPIVSVTLDKKYLTDNKVGIYVEGNYGGGRKNFEYNWRRPANFEYFETADGSSLNQLCETRITGGASRGTALKSLGIYANKRFGTKRLNSEFFPDERPGVTDFKSIMLRNAGNDFDYLYMRDAIIQRIMAENVDVDHQAWSPAIFVLNGEHKGMLNIRERSNEDNVYTNYDGLEDIDMIENWWELKEGTWDNWGAFQNFYKEHGHTYEEYEEWLDVQEFMDVMIANLFFCNLDFPGNNNIFWRPRAKGGRWRMIMKDTDFGIGLYGRSVDYKIFQWLNNPDFDRDNDWANKSEHTRLFRRLMDDPTFYREFIDRFAIYMGDFMNFNRGWEIWEPMYERIKVEYPIHRALYNRWWPNYDEELKNAKNWLKNRTESIYNQLNSYYKVGKPFPLYINKALDEDALKDISVSFNGWTLTRGSFDGKFFEGREVTLKGENVRAWKVINGGAPVEYPGDTFTIKMPAHSLSIIAVVGNPDGIDEISDETSPSEFFNLSGVPTNGLQKGLCVVRNGDGSSKIIFR